MRSRATLLFLVIATAPLALLAWVGIMLVRQEQAQAREVWTTTLEERLSVVENVLSLEMQRLEDAFDGLLREADLNSAGLKELPRNQPMIRSAFLLNAEGRLLLPDPATASSVGDSASFLRRTNAVWESGIPLGSVPADVESEAGEGIAGAAAPYASSSPSRRSETFLKRAEGRVPVSKLKSAKPSPSVSASGWHVWFYGSGPQMIFWQKREDGRVVGLEVEMTALLSLLINRLSNNIAPAGSGLMKLTSADGKSTLHQWGDAKAEAVGDTVVKRAAPAPLSMWQIGYSPAPGEGPRSRPEPVLLSLGAAALAFVALAWLFYRESQREMREARKRVSFVNQVSHELKTPLTNIRLYAEMAQQQIENDNPPAANRHLAVVEAETSRLSRLIHNVLTFARQQRHELEVHTRGTLLDEVAGRCVALWRPGLEARGFQVVTDLDAPEPFCFDPDAVEQILGNLLSNVEKYAANGHFVKIATSQGERQSQIVVEDHGPGIPARQQQEIFRPFVRLHGELTEGVSGTGIGLAISRRLAELHGGTLEMEKTGQANGARFVLRLPRRSLPQ